MPECLDCAALSAAALLSMSCFNCCSTISVDPFSSSGCGRPAGTSDHKWLIPLYPPPD